MRYYRKNLWLCYHKASENHVEINERNNCRRGKEIIVVRQGSNCPRTNMSIAPEKYAHFLTADQSAAQLLATTASFYSMSPRTGMGALPSGTRPACLRSDAASARPTATTRSWRTRFYRGNGQICRHRMDVGIIAGQCRNRQMGEKQGSHHNITRLHAAIPLPLTVLRSHPQ